MRFLKADYDFKAGVLKKEFLKLCFNKKASSGMDTKEQWEGIKQELAEKKVTQIMGKEQFKNWI